MDTNKMRDLKVLAEDASQGHWNQDGLEVQNDDIEDYRVARCRSLADAAFIAAASPTTVLALLAEIERLKGLRPEGPPRPPDGEGLPRYGLRWNGPQQPLAVPMDDGYWTPWHLADRLKGSVPAPRFRAGERQAYQDPDFNKWLDEPISDAGHTVWDAIYCTASAWHAWDACKSALGYYCPSCNGSGEEIHLSDQSPDAYEILGDCSACKGDGRASIALAVANERNVELLDAHLANTSELFLLDRLKTENEALRKDAKRYASLRDGGYLHGFVSIHPCDEHRTAELTDQAVDRVLELKP